MDIDAKAAANNSTSSSDGTGTGTSAAFEIDVDALMEASDSNRRIGAETTTTVQRREASEGISSSTNVNITDIANRQQQQQNRQSNKSSESERLSPALEGVLSSRNTTNSCISSTAAVPPSKTITSPQQPELNQSQKLSKRAARFVLDDSSSASSTAPTLKPAPQQQLSASQIETIRAAQLAMAEDEAEKRRGSNSVLAPQSTREAREHGKIKQPTKQSTDEGEASSPAVASLPCSIAAVASLPSNNDTITTDHQAALALARQDLHAKTTADENRETVADQRRKAGEQQEHPPTASTRGVPVGAFRINPSGPVVIQSAADADVSVSPTESTPSTNNSSTPPVLMDSNVVLESTLVVEEDEEDRSMRRRNRRTNEEAAAENDTTGVDNNPVVEAAIDEEHALPPAVEEAKPDAPADDPGDMVITAERPTLNNSVWTLLKSRKGRWGIGVLVALVATLTVLGVTVWENNNEEGSPTARTSNPTYVPSMAPTSSLAPSAAPTIAPTSGTPTAAPTIRALTLQDLPLETITLIETQPDSPQARAWRWLQQDHDGNSQIPQAEQSLQRFVLVTLYYATNGPGWQFQRYWLDHETSECNWWPHVTGVTWPYDQGPRVCTSKGEYTHLLLADNSLDGTLPPEVALMPYLAKMDVSNNPELTGEIPEGICEAQQAGGLDVLISCNAELTCDCDCSCV